VGHTEKIVSLKFSPDGSAIATASGDGAMRVRACVFLHGALTFGQA
jgi:WD40 repeat protein